MAMSLRKLATRSAALGVMVLLLVFAVDAGAQGYRPGPFDLVEQEREMDLQAINSYVGKRRAAGFNAAQRPERWTLFGRLGPMNFTNQLDGDGSGVQFTLRRNGHGVSGRIYVGLHRRF